MTLAAGKKLGPYEILGPLGAGGMGEVYRAKDTRLDRTVAVKVLPLHLSADPDAKQRFDREARSISSLAHPNICHLYDVGHQDGTDFLVMEFLEGETLAARILKGPLTTEQVLKIGGEICDGLQKAHKTGVVHRDLKPANIMLTKSGAKLMDFGLAKSTAAVAPSASSMTGPMLSPAPSGPLTQAGTIVGTFQYMSPEQVEGKEADTRSDIFSLGAVFYEMATARRAFEGKTTASVIAAILEREPLPISTVQPNSPLMLDRLVKTCLAKDPDDRWQTAHDVKLQLQSISDVGSQMSAHLSAASTANSAAASEVSEVVAAAAARAQSRRNRDRALLILGTAIVTAIVAGALGFFAHPAKPETKLAATITLPPNLQVEPYNISFAFSPDSQKIAFIGVGDDGRSNIYIRPLDSELPQLLPGTEGAASPFWSPDGRSLGFFADKKLKRIDVLNASVTTICDAPAGRGGSWSNNGLILFAPSNQTGLSTVSATGGTPAPITTLGTETGTDRVPFFLPDGKHALFVRSTLQFTAPGTVYVLDVSSKKIEKLFDSDSEAQYAEPGYILFSRDGNLLAQSFNASSLKVSGEPIVIAQHIAFNAVRRAAQFAVSKSGLLLYALDTGVSMKQLTWFNLEDGTEAGKFAEPNRFLSLRLSPDDKRAVAAIADGKSSSIASDKSIWIYDLARASTTRLTFSSGAYEFPVWSGDGQSVFYVESRPPAPIMQKSANGNSEAKQVFSDGMLHQINATSPDGQSLAFSTQIPRDFRIDILPLAPDSKPSTFLAQDSNARAASFSSDGKWLSYISDQTGRYELYVVPYPGPGGKWQISKDGVIDGGWLKAPNKLAYQGADSKLYIVDVATKGGTFDIVKTRSVFDGRAFPATAPYLSVPYLITADAKRVIVPKVIKDDAPNSLTLITDWSADLKKP
jgi:serine/threonine protein kinase/Tol biopolymer transport system component